MDKIGMIYLILIFIVCSILAFCIVMFISILMSEVLTEVFPYAIGIGLTFGLIMLLIVADDTK